MIHGLWRDSYSRCYHSCLSVLLTTEVPLLWGPGRNFSYLIDIQRKLVHFRDVCESQKFSRVIKIYVSLSWTLHPFLSIKVPKVYNHNSKFQRRYNYHGWYVINFLQLRFRNIRRLFVSLFLLLMRVTPTIDSLLITVDPWDYKKDLICTSLRLTSCSDVVEEPTHFVPSTPTSLLGTL